MQTTTSSTTATARTNGNGLSATGAKLANPRTLILPRDRSQESRIISLENPRTTHSENYFLCPTLGLFEFTVVKAPSSEPRSVFITSRREQRCKDEGQTTSNQDNQCQSEDNDYNFSSVSKDAHIFVATPMDVLFFVLPILSPPGRSQGRSHNLFQPIDDMIESNDALSKTLKSTLLGSLRSRAEARMKVVCDTVEAGDGLMFRLNERRLVEELLRKAERAASEKGLPPSMEDHFVRRALELPLLNVKRDDVVKESCNESNEEDPSHSASTKATSQTDQTDVKPAKQETSITSKFPDTVDEQLEKRSQIPGYDASDEVVRLLRIRTALSFIMSSYIPNKIVTLVEKCLSSPESPLDFGPLQEQLKRVADLRAKARAARLADNISRKRPLSIDDMLELSAEKRHKAESEKKERESQSPAVRSLKRADTSGMKKLSSFFVKKEPGKKT